MTLRARIGIGAAAAAAIAVIAAAIGTYAAASATLNGEVDDALRRAASAIGDQQQPYGQRPGRFGGAGVFAELVDSTG